MKKMIQFHILLGAIFLYLVYRVSGQDNHIINLVIIMEYFEGIIKIVLGVCSMTLTWNTMKIKMNSRANFMAVSAQCIGIFTIFKIGIYMNYSECGRVLRIIPQCRWIMEYIQIIGLMIGINYVQEHNSLRIWSFIYVAICMISAILIGSSLKFSDKMVVYEEIVWMTKLIGISCIVLVIVIYIMSYKKIKSLSHMEAKMISILFGIKILVNTLQGFQLIKNQVVGLLIYQVAQIIFSVVLIVYIDKLTLSVTWKKIDRGVQNKNEKVIRGYSEQKMLVSAAHQIQQLIEGIDQKISYLEKQIAPSHNGQHIKYIHKIKNNCLRLLKLSTDILDLNLDETDYKPHTFEQINMAVLIGQVVESLETYTMQKGIKIAYTCSDACIMAEVDKEAIERLFLNLLSNAIKYNKINGTIKVTLTEKKNQIYLCVQDTGIGIPSHYLDLIFEKFQRVEAGLAREQEGGGLGLAIVKSIVDSHHGEIKIISKEESGTLISIQLPAKQEAFTDPLKCKTVYKESLNKKIQLELLGIDR